MHRAPYHNTTELVTNLAKCPFHEGHSSSSSANCKNQPWPSLPPKVAQRFWKMQASRRCLLLALLLFSSYFTFASCLSTAEASLIARRQLLALRENAELPSNYEYLVDVNETFANSRLRRAYIALQAWKKVVYSDPLNTTRNWVGPSVCEYNGVFCSPALDDPNLSVVAGVDLNGADIAGYLPPELGLLGDLALFHINSNRFCGVIPESFEKLTILYELDVSNNRRRTYLDIRYNDFEGKLPPQLFDKDFDAIFLNNNRFTSTIPENFGNSPGLCRGCRQQ
ncbi:hypothetical protein NL676_025036 [Syzygium grande]|nr:hypothetical protein NL676_025036 [Syzygium grande]